MTASTSVMQLQLRDRARGALLGLAIGDALGAPIEGLREGQFEPVTGFAPTPRWGIGPGDWTDDTSMALCLADSLIARHGYDSYDVMDRYCRWVTDGYRSVNGVCFDIGSQTSAATRSYRRDGATVFADRPRSKQAGNGTVMRLAPASIALLSGCRDGSADAATVDRFHAVTARETHYSAEAEAATVIFGRLLIAALYGMDVRAALDQPLDNVADPFGYVPWLRAAATKPRSMVRSGGYIKETMEAAVWATVTTNSFQEAVLAAVNLGHDADTVGAVTGQLAGAYYGIHGIPAGWVRGVAQSDEILDIADRLAALERVPILVTRFEGDAEFGPRPVVAVAEELPAADDAVSAPRRRWLSWR